LLEIAIAPYRVKTGKKGKGNSTSSIPAPVAQSVLAVLKESQDLVRSFATEFKASEASDPLLGQNYAVDLFKKMELVELVRVVRGIVSDHELNSTFCSSVLML
jgi:hypothetical protein